MSAIYKLINLNKIYKSANEDLHILNDLNLEITAGESLAIVGASGCGKSTLLHLLGTLDHLSSGEILYKNKNLNQLNEGEKAQFRNQNLGFIFQFHYLLSEFNCLENVAMHALIAGESRKKAFKKAEEALELVGLNPRKKYDVTQLSGGERQRVAIARAILSKPEVLLADEPTGNLDFKTGAQINELLLSLNKQLGTTLIIVTHNHELAQSMHLCFELRDGKLLNGKLSI